MEKGDGGIIGQHAVGGNRQLLPLAQGGAGFHAIQMGADHRVKAIFEDIAQQVFGIQRVGNVDRRMLRDGGNRLAQAIHHAEGLGGVANHGIIQLGGVLAHGFAGKAERIGQLGLCALCKQCFLHSQGRAVMPFARVAAKQ